MGLMRPSLKKLSIHDAAGMMWGILRCYKLMNEFVSHKFLGQPKLLIYSVNHLSCLMKDLEPMKKQADQLQMEMGAMLGELDKKEDKLGGNKVV
ncbi:unnamed protein product [Cylindrotheca closterium]|uniref:Uncharacterized protein n=1 Tax=Cylindrotheca closterium TaxID=2856 RepID=A0AAD2PV54_9STRA|nr:unnamed protein product [Cylindrotheca closterium]